MQSSHFSGTAIAYPQARSSSDQNIIAAAETRAKFWKYPADGPWTVYVSVGKRTVSVTRSSDGETSIKR